jgi:hypothetical protein
MDPAPVGRCSSGGVGTPFFRRATNRLSAMFGRTRSVAAAPVAAAPPQMMQISPRRRRFKARLSPSRRTIKRTLSDPTNYNPLQGLFNFNGSPVSRSSPLRGPAPLRGKHTYLIDRSVNRTRRSSARPASKGSAIRKATQALNAEAAAMGMVKSSRTRSGRS